jgi:exodeoxyribonuclease VII small subunit
VNKKKQSFEDALEQLEATIAKLESDDLALEEALDYFEKGVALMRVCDEHLRGAEGKLKELLKGENGQFVEKVLGMTLDSVLGNEERDV